ncbi:MAG: hypothetical protein HN368_17960, partial [Spirochaetales bacterium]|nr:hypothetical protein [Spirochaetales bacterium]
MNKKKYNSITIIFVYLFVVVLVPVAAQNTQPDDVFFNENLGKVIRLETIGKGEFQGMLYHITHDLISMVDDEGQVIQILRTQITNVIVIDPESERSAYYQDAAANRLIIMPTAFGMDAGEFHIAVQEIVAVSASYGVSSNFSIWGGISIPGAVLNARYSMELGEFGALSLGTFAGFEWLFDGGAVFLPYAILSIGSEVENITIGMAAAATTNSPYFHGIIIPVAGKLVLSPSASIITENWF